MSEEIVELLDELPADNMTVKVLEALDAVVPGEWENIIGCDNTITAVTGETDPDRIASIRDRAIELYNDENNDGYRTAIWIYRNVDNADNAVAATAMAAMISEKIPFFSFLSNITPKADTTQSIDLALKIVAELVAYAKLNGIPELEPEAFVAELTENYTGPSKMRMVGLVCLDGLAPLGPDFLQKVQEALDGEEEGKLADNPIFSAISGLIPGDDKLGFVRNAFGAVSGWMDGLVSSTGLTPEIVSEKIGGFIDFSDDALDVVAAFIDQTTIYYKHTGIQSVARKLIAQAAEEV